MWKNFNFGAKKEDDVSSIENQPTKKVKPKKSKPIKKPSFTLDFQSLISPKEISDLAVHSKKIEALQDWLTLNRGSSFLLLTGPSGCGKTATLVTLCKQMNITINEWINPIDQDFELVRGGNQINRFTEFLTETNYNSLFTSEDNSRKIVMLKDFPNALLHRPEEFHNILEEFGARIRNPIIFVINCSSNLEYTLFPDTVKLKYNIANISFNPVSTTLLRKALKRAETLMMNQGCFKEVPANLFDAIVTSSLGDLRSALNQFYLASLADCDQMEIIVTKTQGTKRKRSTSQISIKSLSRDEALGLFHGLGRILQPKFKEDSSTLQLVRDVEKLVDEFSIQPTNCINFLFENYLKYFGDIVDASRASEFLCLAHNLLRHWGEDKQNLMIYAVWLGTLGLMVHNQHKQSKWTQITGPRKINYNSTNRIDPLDRMYYNIINENNANFTFK